MHRELSILQANTRKMRWVQHAMYNDEDLDPFDVILFQEPHCYQIDSDVLITGVGVKWEVLRPRVLAAGRFPIRSCIWIKKHVDFEQVEVGSPDITAVIVNISGRQIYLASVYIPSINTATATGERGPTIDDQHLRTRLQLLQRSVDEERVRYPLLELFLGGDFNRHDLVWGGEEVGLTPRQGEAQGLLEFIEANELQLLLPAGTVTWEGPGQATATIDLAFSTQQLFEDRIRCSVFKNEYGSDHRAIVSSFGIQSDGEARVPPVTKYLFRNASWDNIRKDIADTIRVTPFPETDIDAMNDYLSSAVQQALDKHCPRAKLSVYAKRWWTADLTALRKSYTRTRNRARSLRRQGRPNPVLDQQAKRARHDFHHAIRKLKSDHWIEFLDCPKNIWKAAKYLHPASSSEFGRIASITDTDGVRISDKEAIAKELLQSFFPLPPVPEQPSQDDCIRRPQFESAPITLDEIEQALFSASSDKAPGMDSLTTRVWKEVWPILQNQILTLFKRSLHTGKLPSSWKIAKIIPLKKAGKDNYSQSKNYRPISLLCTLGKVMEAVIAERISFLVETKSLLPNNHFGARKQRSSVQALSYLQERIFDAWRGRKTLSLVSFDVKGAYNNVAKAPELDRLRKRQVPEEMVRWIDDFCTNRQACITVNGFTSEVCELPQSGLPQGSPLAPILFLFFNADLVQTKFRNGNSMAFVDDYTAWIVGESAADNTKRIQEDILPVLKKWERESGAVFEASKTAFIHFTRVKSETRDDTQSLQFKDTLIEPTTVVKILGVLFDQGLRFKLHVSKVAGKAYKAALALKRLKGLRPSSIRQLFSATVAPVMDYASAVWYLGVPDKTIKLLEQAQRVGAQATTYCFRTVALPIAEAEAGIVSLRQRLHDSTVRFWIGLHRLHSHHPHFKLIRRRRVVKRYLSPLQKASSLFQALKVDRIETIAPFINAPWESKPAVFILDAHGAKEATITRFDTLDLYTDGSVRNGLAGIGVWATDLVYSKTVCPAEETNIHLTELEAIYKAIRLPTEPSLNSFHIRIFTDSRMALQCIQKPKRNDSQQLVKKIRTALSGKRISLYWIPGHDRIRGNEEAHKLAQKATEHGTILNSQKEKIPICSVYAEVKRIGFKPKIDIFTKKTGNFTKKIDKALPGKHTRLLYNKLNRIDASILSQLRTGRSRLNGYLAKIAAVENDKCECGALESIPHFLFVCPRWREERRAMREAHKLRFGDLSFALGGYSTYMKNGQRVDGDLGKWIPNLEAVYATIKFARHTKRLDYIPLETVTSHTQHASS